MADRVKLVRDAYGAYESGDRRVLEELLSDDFTFSSPADVGIDRATYFERCWPNAETIVRYEFVRLAGVGDEVVATSKQPRRMAGGFATQRSSGSMVTALPGPRSTSAGTSVATEP